MVTRVPFGRSFKTDKEARVVAKVAPWCQSQSQTILEHYSVSNYGFQRFLTTPAGLAMVYQLFGLGSFLVSLS